MGTLGTRVMDTPGSGLAAWSPENLVLEQRTLVHCGWGSKLAQSLCKTVWRVLKKLKVELPHDSAIPLLGLHRKKSETLI